MASNKKIAEMIMAIKTIYPYYSKDSNSEVLAKTWSLLLKNYPDEAVEASFYLCLQTCKVPPTPADVIEHINAMIETNEPTDEELWSVLTTALIKTLREMRCFEYTFVEENGKTQGDNARNRVEAIWNDLPDSLKHYLGSKGELMRMALVQSDDNLSYEKTKFLKTMPVIKKRGDYTEMKMLLGDSKLLLE